MGHSRKLSRLSRSQGVETGLLQICTSDGLLASLLVATHVLMLVKGSSKECCNPACSI